MPRTERRHSTADALKTLDTVLSEIDVTRLAEQTGLDTIGIPCWAAIRPNGMTLSVHQGKGLTDEAAMVSAAMEAFEFASAERPQVNSSRFSVKDLRRSGAKHWLPSHLLPRDFQPNDETPITWVQGQGLDGEMVLVPLDAVALTPRTEERLPFAQNSSGLAAGLDIEEAIAHGICEVVERDATSLWHLRSLRSCSRTALGSSVIGSSGAEHLESRIRDAGLELRLFDLTSDFGMPCVLAYISTKRPSQMFDVASGICAHPSFPQAVIGAISEACQTRVTNIAASRDDIDPEDFQKPLPSWITALLKIPSKGHGPEPQSLSALAFEQLVQRAQSSIVTVPLTDAKAAVKVVKVMWNGLEDRSANIHWRPGKRAIRAMLQ